MSSLLPVDGEGVITLETSIMFLSWKKRDLRQATKFLDPRRGRNLGQVIVKCACGKGGAVCL